MNLKKKNKFTPYELNFRGRTAHMFKSPQGEGEDSMSGSMADLESDDDVLMAAHMMGLGLSEDYEHPKELNIARDMEKAEHYKMTH